MMFIVCPLEMKLVVLFVAVGYLLSSWKKERHLTRSLFIAAHRDDLCRYFLLQGAQIISNLGRVKCAVLGFCYEKNCS